MLNIVLSVALINIFLKSPGIGCHKGPENINCLLVKYGEIFYDQHTALTPTVVKINRF